MGRHTFFLKAFLVALLVGEFVKALIPALVAGIIAIAVLALLAVAWPYVMFLVEDFGLATLLVTLLVVSLVGRRFITRKPG